LGAPLPAKIIQICRQLTWPQDKPIQEIVFPQILPTDTESLAALWLMLPQQEIYHRLFSLRDNYFSFIASPHPMLLWVTVLYSQELSPKWLPCYLDLQNSQNQRLVWLLAEKELYPLVFFTMEPPHSCINVLGSLISAPKRQNLKNWVIQSQKLPATSLPQVSKNLLKQQYKQMQFQILQQLKSLPPVSTKLI
jgi:hypothetical protein